MRIIKNFIDALDLSWKPPIIHERLPKRKSKEEVAAWANQDDQSYSAEDGLDPFEYEN